ncbi:hypothetical protein EMCG_01101 [[Emmonsia] crescens]|uniref:Uncharacterized protein n=1 Tax=[Emmonsia] crescens TaxID=73230 RepID=A0A0G2I9Q0_9EURO|nr:hypothetical protein EMCG_01101 [Emmonsia crescens UAMH 3008]
MNDDLYCWEMELLKQFGRSRQQAMQEALYLRYRFSDRHNLPISSYFTRKVSLLREAGITDQIQLVQHLYDGLEAQLQVSCPIDEFADDFPSLNEFQRKVKNQEAAAFKLWTLNRQASRSSSKQFGGRETRFNKPEASSFNRFRNPDRPQTSDREKDPKPTAQTSDYKNNSNNFNNQRRSSNFRNPAQGPWKKPSRNNQAFHAVQHDESAQEDTNLPSASDISDDDQNEHGSSFSSIQDTGSGLSLIEADTVSTRFPSATINSNPNNIQIFIHGVSDKPLLSSKYAIIPLQYNQTHQHSHLNPDTPHPPIFAIFHVVDILPPRMIISIDIMHEIQMSIQLGYPDTLQFRVNEILTTIQLTKSAPPSHIHPPSPKDPPNIPISTQTLLTPPSLPSFMLWTPYPPA